MKRACIVINGNLTKLPTLSKLLRTNDMLICADGAAEHVYKQDIIPHVIIGDLDSIPSKVKKFYETKDVLFQTFPQEKDATDTELAITYALDHGSDELLIYGLLGDRMDHILSNVFYLSKIAQKVPCTIIEGCSNLYFSYNNISLEGMIGDEVSLIPFQEDCKGITTTGLYYSLKNEVLKYGSTRGVSNVFVKPICTINFKSGNLLIIHNKKTV